MQITGNARENSTFVAPLHFSSASFASTACAENAVVDDELVARAREGNEAAMAELLSRYEGKLLRLALRFVRNEHDAQEVLQEVCFTVWRRLPSFEGRSQIGTWLHRITVNAALMFLRSRARNPRPRSTTSEMTDDGNTEGFGGFESLRRVSHTPDDQLQFLELHCELQKAVEGLPLGLRDVFLARLVEGRSTRQTASSLGLSTIAVKTRLHRARARLRENMNRYRAQD